EGPRTFISSWFPIGQTKRGDMAPIVCQSNVRPRRETALLLIVQASVAYPQSRDIIHVLHIVALLLLLGLIGDFHARGSLGCELLAERDYLVRSRGLRLPELGAQ